MAQLTLRHSVAILGGLVGGEPVYMQIVTFNLTNCSQAELEKICRELAPQFAAVPGLISKVYLSDPANNIYGGVYTWQDRASYDAYTRTELFKLLGSRPIFSNVVLQCFDVLEEPTRVTRGLITQTTAA